MKKYYFISLSAIIILLTLLVIGCFTPKKQVEFVLRQSFLVTAYVPVCPYCKSQVGDKATTCRSCSKDFKWITKELPCLKCEGNGYIKCFKCVAGKCYTCNGNSICSRCRGDGKPHGLIIIDEDKCLSCDGSGKCADCKGTGICSICNGTSKIPCKECNETGKIIVGK
ncbi:MAG: hypothetical protein ABRQ39_30565 [Candidatus Eremiobacterota bacterium]